MATQEPLGQRGTRLAIVTGAIAASLLVGSVIVAWAVLHRWYMERPMFTSWRQGELGWAWRLDRVRSSRFQILVDDSRALVAVVFPGVASVKSDVRSARVYVPQKKWVTISDTPNRLVVINADATAEELATDSGFAFRYLALLAELENYDYDEMLDCVAEACGPKTDEARRMLGLTSPP